MATKTTDPQKAEEAARARWGAAKQKAAERLAAAQSAEQEAKAALTELRERHKSDGSVTAEEFGTAAHAVELAELEHQGAEDALAEAGRQERLDALERIRVEMEAKGRPEHAAAAFSQTVDGLRNLIREIGPPRTAMVSGWIRDVRRYDVAPVHGGDRPDPEDSNVAWSDTGWGGSPGSVIWLAEDGTKRSCHTRYDEVRILAAAVYAACRAEGVAGSIFGVSVTAADNALIEDPDAWFLRNG